MARSAGVLDCVDKNSGQICLFSDFDLKEEFDQ